MNSPLISVVVTVYNEEDNVRPLLEQLHAALAALDYELVYRRVSPLPDHDEEGLLPYLPAGVRLILHL